MDLCRPARKPKRPAEDRRTLPIPGTETAADIAATAEWQAQKTAKGAA